MRRIQCGTPFTSTAFCGIWVPLKVRIGENILEVQISSPTNVWKEEWNLQHTMAGFSNGTYDHYDPAKNFIGEAYTGLGELIVCPTQLLHPEAQAPFASEVAAMGHDITTVAGLEGLENENSWDAEQLDAWEKFGLTKELAIRPNDSFLFRTGFKQAINPGWGCLFWDRSGMGGKKLIHRFAGVIDESYRGEWFVRLFNHSTQTHIIKPGDKIVQGVYQRRVRAICPIVQSLDATERGTGGFGSTGD